RRFFAELKWFLNKEVAEYFQERCAEVQLELQVIHRRIVQQENIASAQTMKDLFAERAELEAEKKRLEAEPHEEFSDE
ncbi:MAG TPA: hypothetical protein DF383_13660, partial [Deltaproteobacteria bacterium]|nr:hypothetical protein [Deltaproteobacteria bacterium]